MKLKDFKGVYFEDNILICDKETVLARQDGYFSEEVIWRIRRGKYISKLFRRELYRYIS